MRRTLYPMLLVALGAVLGPAHAQSWPTKPVRLILSQPPGASPDIAARIVADRLSRHWGQQVVVDNRPGGQNVIGAQIAARSAPDGYNFYWATTAAVVTNLYTFKSLPYDPKKDFAPVALAGLSPFVFAVNPGVPAQSIGELIALDKRDPGKLSLATEGPKSFSGMVSEMLNLTAGTKFLLVPYVGAPQAMNDAAGGTINIVITSSAAMSPFLKRGALRPLAVTAAKRVQGLDEVPTLAESYPGFAYVGWYVVVAPTGTQAEVIAKANRDIDAALKDPDVSRKLHDLGLVVDGAGSLAAVQAFLDSEHARWSKVIKDVGIQPE